MGLIKSSPASSSSFLRSGQSPVSFTGGTTPSSLVSCEKPRGHKVWMMETSVGLQSTVAAAPRTVWSGLCGPRDKGLLWGHSCTWPRWPRRPHQWHSGAQSLVLSSPHLRSLPPPISFVPANPGSPPSWGPHNPCALTVLENLTSYPQIATFSLFIF